MTAFPFSCDTSVVLGTATIDGSVIFAKNSDRNPNECQPLTHVPRLVYGPGAMTRCQYIEIPQVAETWEMIGSRPYWLRGFEIGVNEWGVAVGNEAVHTREPYEEQALIGMDLIRLALERATSAGEAVSVIGDLVERYGQGGSCEATGFRTYHNSYIVADPVSSWVVETAGHRWIAERATDRRAISNLLTITGSGDRSSPGLEAHARDQGWTTGEFDFAAAYQDPNADLTPRICRLLRARDVLASYREPVTVQSMMALLRDHDDRGRPAGAQSLPTICMHAGPSYPGETAAAMVVQLRPNLPKELTTTCWTAFGSPCLSVFRPVYPFAVGLPSVLDRGGATFDADSPWWQSERLQRMAAVSPSVAAKVETESRALESCFLAETRAVEAQALDLLERGNSNAARDLLRAHVDDTTARATELVRSLAAHALDASVSDASPEMTMFWKALNTNCDLSTN